MFNSVIIDVAIGLTLSFLAVSLAAGAMSFAVALAIAAIFNVNALYESAQIWSRPSVIADLTTSHFQNDCDQASTEAAKIFNALEPEFLIGWVKGPMPHDPQSWFIAGASWLIAPPISSPSPGRPWKFCANCTPHRAGALCFPRSAEQWSTDER
jgi:hypothetical protein